nr:MAG TPA: hypothetical protein [Bacteriophage sp.]
MESLLFKRYLLYISMLYIIPYIKAIYQAIYKRYI